MYKFKIFSGSSHPKLAAQIAFRCEQPVSKCDSKAFSCGERYFKFNETVRGHDVFIIQTGRTGDMNEDLIELFLMIDAAKQSFAHKVHVVLPYMPYSRQDKIHEPREGISSKMFSRLIQEAGADHVITLHLHSDQIQGFFDIPVDNLNPRKLFVDYYKQKNLENAVVVSPDAGGAKTAKRFADDLGVPLAIMHKQRPEHNQSEVTHIIGDVAGKTPIIIDDIVDTAGSVCATKKALVESGGAHDEVYLCATHPVFSGPAVERLSEASFAEILTTDTLPVDEPPTNYQTLSVADLLGEVILNVRDQRSVSNLYY